MTHASETLPSRASSALLSAVRSFGGHVHERAFGRPRFAARREIFEYERLLHGPPDQVFPLLCPTREYEWIEDWSCDLIYSKSGYAEENCVFKSRLDLGETWLIIRRDPEDLVFQAVIFAGRHLLVRADVLLVDNGDGTTTGKWRYTYTALDRVGNWLIEHVARARLDRTMAKLTAQLDHYLTTGEMLVTKKS